MLNNNVMKLFFRMMLLLCFQSHWIGTAAQQTRKDAFAFELKDTLGRGVRLSDFKGKTLVMDFWFTGCKACVQVAQYLHQVVIPQFQSDTNVVFIAVSTDISFLQWKKSIRSRLYSNPPQLNLFTMGMGSQHPLCLHYGFEGAPQMLLIDKDGRLISSVNPGPQLVEMIRKEQRTH